MSAAKIRHKDGVKITGKLRRVTYTARAAEMPETAPAGPVDVKALFDNTMRRYPKTMARLAE
jgi:hypothetical protein